MTEPVIIQGGMGIGVSGWQLARAVSAAGHMGTVSGVVLDVFFARRLQDGDVGGHLRRAAAHFPQPEMAQRVVDKFYVEGGKAPAESYMPMPSHAVKTRRDLQELALVANFSEVWLAKEGHDYPVAINYMEKLRVTNMPALYGAMLAGVDYVAVGAGIPREIPGVIDSFAAGEVARQRLDVEGAGADDDFTIQFDPSEVLGRVAEKIARPKFLAIVASTVLAISMARKANGQVDGFVIEGPLAGGHNAPPRGEMQLDSKGEPIYGARDQVDFEKIRALGIPFWLGGGYGHPERISAARELGAAGVQIGTPFALSSESNLRSELKESMLDAVRAGTAKIFTSPTASPSGFPFKLACLPGTLSEPEVYDSRQRVCDMSYLRHAYKKDDGSLGWRCSAEPVDTFVAKGGSNEGAAGRICLCNGLIANIGFAQTRQDGYVEPPVVTMGDDVYSVKPLLERGQTSFSATDLIDYLLPQEPV